MIYIIIRIKSFIAVFIVLFALAYRCVALSSEIDVLGVNSMMAVYPDSKELPSHSKILNVGMAKNEFESVQAVIVAPDDSDIHGLKWNFDEIGSGISVTISPVGWARMSHAPPLTIGHEWNPTILLSFLDTIDVKSGEVQILWVTARTSTNTPAGDYHSTLHVSSDSGSIGKIPLNIHVFNFSIPIEQSLKTIWGNGENRYKEYYKDIWSEELWKDILHLFLDHRLSVNTLYAEQSGGKVVQFKNFTSSIDFPSFTADPDLLKDMWVKGSRLWNLGYINENSGKVAGLTLEEFTTVFIEMMDNALKVADSIGWPHENIVIYCFDESKNISEVQKAGKRIKEAFPDISLISTCRDRSYGIEGGPLDDVLDIWVPHTSTYRMDYLIIKEARAKARKKIYYYVSCCGNVEDTTLDFFIEYNGNRGRLLTGAAAWKYKTDGFLYYSLYGWSQYNGSKIDNGPYTNWLPYEGSQSTAKWPDGDGQLLVPGPKGPLSTLMFESVRDGLEDYEYYHLLNDLVVKAEGMHIDVSEEKKYLSIPDSMLVDFFVFERNVDKWDGWRWSLADAIESVTGKISFKK